MDELAEHEAFMAEVDALRRLRNAAALLVALKDGPRDAHYAAAKPGVWEILRGALDEAVHLAGDVA